MRQVGRVRHPDVWAAAVYALATYGAVMILLQLIAALVVE